MTGKNGSKKPARSKKKVTKKATKKAGNKSTPNSSAKGRIGHPDPNYPAGTKQDKRSTKFQPVSNEQKDAFVENLRAGHTIQESAELAGFGYRCYYRWMKHRDTNPEYAVFFKKCEEALEHRVTHVVDALYQAALKGDVQAQKYFLNNRGPRNWKDKQTVTIEGKVEHSGEVDHTAEIDRLRKEGNRLQSMLNKN